MAKNIFVCPIEKLESRYSWNWYDHIPKLLDAAIKTRNLDIDVTVIDGDDVPPTPTPGAFLDFGATNIFKSSQLLIIAQLFRENRVKSGDKFLYTDAWNPNVMQLRYMSKLLGIDVEIHGLWHASSSDPQDFLGRLIGDVPWIRHAEKAMFECFDTNWYATKFSRDLLDPYLHDYRYSTSEKMITSAKKTKLTGWPMEYLKDILQPYVATPKKNQIVFPHRLAPEKQLNIFKDLAASMPEYDWVVCQEQKLSKPKYHQMLAESKICFSASLQETLGISQCLEAPLVNTLPFTPDRLSYSEIFNDHKEFLYPSNWTINWESYLVNKEKLMYKISQLMQASDETIKTLTQFYVSETFNQFGSSHNLVNELIKD
jgi:glycosyltransferase involved in cell wall biosynthesis